MNIFNLAMAVVPLVATFKPSRLTDVFVYEFFFKGSPLIRRGTKLDLASLVSLYKKIDLNITKQYTSSELLEELRNMTSKGEMFSPERVTTVGLYGASSLCYPDLFSTASQILGYKIVYMIENSIHLAVIIICYVLIVKEFLKSRNAVQQAAPGAQQGQRGENENQNIDKGFYLSFKVSVVIGTQLVCWLPVHGAMIASFTGTPPSSIITDVFTTNIAPLNAVMNPILHTDLQNRFVPFLVKKIQSMKAKLDKIGCFHKAADRSQSDRVRSEGDNVNIVQGGKELGGSCQIQRSKPEEEIGEVDMDKATNASLTGVEQRGVAVPKTSIELGTKEKSGNEEIGKCDPITLTSEEPTKMEMTVISEETRRKNRQISKTL
jgi:hypothetical protein